jgi:hypothetical protein
VVLISFHNQDFPPCQICLGRLPKLVAQSLVKLRREKLAFNQRYAPGNATCHRRKRLLTELD